MLGKIFRRKKKNKEVDEMQKKKLVLKDGKLQEADKVEEQVLETPLPPVEQFTQEELQILKEREMVKQQEAMVAKAREEQFKAMQQQPVDVPDMPVDVPDMPIDVPDEKQISTVTIVLKTGLQLEVKLLSEQYDVLINELNDCMAYGKTFRFGELYINGKELAFFQLSN